MPVLAAPALSWPRAKAGSAVPSARGSPTHAWWQLGPHQLRTRVGRPRELVGILALELSATEQALLPGVLGTLLVEGKPDGLVLGQRRNE